MFFDVKGSKVQGCWHLLPACTAACVPLNHLQLLCSAVASQNILLTVLFWRTAAAAVFGCWCCLWRCVINCAGDFSDAAVEEFAAAVKRTPSDKPLDSSMVSDGLSNLDSRGLAALLKELAKEKYAKRAREVRCVVDK